MTEHAKAQTVELRDGSVTKDARLDLLKQPSAVDLDRYHVLELARPEGVEIEEAEAHLNAPAPGVDWPKVSARLISQTDRTERLWKPGPVLDQQSEGACVAHAFVGDALAEPRGLYLDDSERAQLDAFELYWRAQLIDPWPETHQGGAGGTSLEAGAKVCIEDGHFREYRWAADVDELIAALLRGRKDGEDVFGPAIVAVKWYEAMYDCPANDPVVRPGGEFVGWHAILIRGVNLEQPGFGEPMFLWRNSWGPGYGIGGDALVSYHDLTNLLGDEPEIMFPVGRRKAKNVEVPPDGTTSEEITGDGSGVALPEVACEPCLKGDCQRCVSDGPEGDCYCAGQGHPGKDSLEALGVDVL